ncbi:hypothetical protein ABW19_dt0208048 [Dactylella cylindrospora]|nr:hypothetical protein ABW19_dt0208048 [Dactylella cylindrospora]
MQLPRDVIVRSPSPVQEVPMVYEVGNWFNQVFGPPDPEAPLPPHLQKHLETLPIVSLLNRLNNLLSSYRLSLQDIYISYPQESVYAFDVPNTWLHTDLCSNQDFFFQNAPDSIQLADNIITKFSGRTSFFRSKLSDILKTSGPVSAAAILDFITLLIYQVSNNIETYSDRHQMSWLAKTIADYKLLGPLRALLELGGTSIRAFARSLLEAALRSSHVDIAKLVLSTILSTEDRITGNIGKSPILGQATPLNFAVASGNIELIKTLLEIGADVNTEFERDDFIVTQKRCVCGAVLKSPWTPLGIAASLGRLDICSLLLLHNANPNLQWRGESVCPYPHVGETALQIVTKCELYRSGSLESSGHFRHQKWELLDTVSIDVRQERLKIAELLIQRGASINPPCSCGALTPIQNAIAIGDKDMIDLLLQNGADISLHAYPKHEEYLYTAMISGASNIGADWTLQMLRSVLELVHDQTQRTPLLQTFLYYAISSQSDAGLFELVLANGGSSALDELLLVQMETRPTLRAVPCLDPRSPRSETVSAPVAYIFCLYWAVRHSNALVVNAMTKTTALRSYFHGSCNQNIYINESIQDLMLPYKNTSAFSHRVLSVVPNGDDQEHFGKDYCVPGEQIKYEDPILRRSSNSVAHPLVAQDSPFTIPPDAPPFTSMDEILKALGASRRGLLDLEDTACILEFLVKQAGGDPSNSGIPLRYTIRFTDAIRRADYPLVRLLSRFAEGEKSFLIASEAACLLAAVGMRPFTPVAEWDGICYPRSIFLELVLDRVLRMKDKYSDESIRKKLLDKALYMLIKSFEGDGSYQLSFLLANLSHAGSVDPDGGPEVADAAACFKLLIDAGAELRPLDTENLLCLYLTTPAFVEHLKESESRVIAEVDGILRFGASINASIPIEMCDFCSPEFDDYMESNAPSGSKQHPAYRHRCTCTYARGPGPQHVCSAIMFAAKSGSIGLVDHLLRKGAVLNPHLLPDAEQQKYIGTPLQVAARNNDMGMAVYLLNAGADVNAPGHPAGTYWMTPLIYAVRNGNLEMAKLFLNKGANISTSVFRELRLNTMHNCQADDIGMPDEFDLECRKFEPGNEISWAQFVPKKNPYDVYPIEVFHGANGGADSGGQSGGSTFFGDEEVEFDIDVEDLNDWVDEPRDYTNAITAAILSRKESSETIIALLQSHGAAINSEVISKCCKNCTEDRLRFLLTLGADPREILEAAIHSNWWEEGGILDELLDQGVRYEPKDGEDRLLYAVLTGRIDLVIQLLASGAIANVKEPNKGEGTVEVSGRTDISVWNVHTDTLESLVHNPNALEIAASDGRADITDLLLKTGEFINNTRAADIARKKGFIEVADLIEAFRLPLDDSDALIFGKQ